ncbi:Nitrogen fixation regulation protein FixK [Hartmannibacter diazotrophicus]|uniref:Nitrogen fixation regulation protein FixK n=1 Tax=Hartmannibacter diazotrophicus TaxID=1482074 RepID=A0A2C9DDH8_9HYPH|nr:helix-turn-helix domain-containing protein [Hartmannibacter diazotrophicus]SON58316.1 Nitrogen fixation regulation protein FixK [Hartmannibacter diazotrophicus]
MLQHAKINDHASSGEGEGRYRDMPRKARPESTAWTSFLASRSTRTERHHSHDVICYEDDPATHLFEIAQGSVMLYRLLGDGRRQVVDILSPGDLFGLAPSGYYDCSAEALCEVTLRVLDRHEIDVNPALQAHVNHCLASRIELLHSHAVLLGRKSAAERVATFLMRFVPERGVVGCPGPAVGEKDNAVVVLRMTRQEIADYLGLTIETVSRVLSDFKRRGIISIEKNDRIHLPSVCRICKMTGIH